jgi:peptidoglycan/LPS O-acetylase OafA/YrhL
MAQAGQASQEDKVKIRSLELGRFAAAVMVLLSHAVPYANAHAAAGTAPLFGGLMFPGPLGVQYFFVLSGFVMAHAHHRDYGKFAAIPLFLWRRACRIYPAYWLALCIPVFYLHGGMDWRVSLHMVLLDPWYLQEYIPATWSLRYEMAFYIMFSLCLLPYVGRLLLAFWIFIVIWRWQLVFLFPHAVPVLAPIVSYSTAYGNRFVDLFEVYFFAGLAAGYAFAKLRCGWRVWAGVLALGGLAFAGLLPREAWGNQYGSGALFIIAMALAIGAVVLGIAGLEQTSAFRLGRLAAWLGAMSYPLYIFHEPMMLIIDRQAPWGTFTTVPLYIHFALLCAAILGVAASVTFLFDQPVQRALRRLTRRIWRAAASPAAAPLYSPNPGN